MVNRKVVVPTILNNKFIAFLKLIRVENLVMIALTQLFLRFFVLGKVFPANGIQLGLDNTLFYLVVLSTVLIAAAGYIINDYFDVKTDLINHPDTVVVDKVIKRRLAIFLHLTFTFLGIFIGAYAAFKIGYLRLAAFHVIAAILLWFYSTHLKKTLLFGNITVSLLTASVVFMPLVYEMGVMQQLHPGFIFEYKHVVLSSLKITLIFSLFAFITSMAREIIKDIEDFRGDLETGGRTMPIVWGERSAKICAFFLLIITSLLLFFVVYNTVRIERKIFSLDLIYILFLLILPLVFLSVYTMRATTPKGFKRASLFLKLIMFLGLSYSFIFYYS